MFALIADGCRDCSNKEQMELMYVHVVRYADQNNQIQECFVVFVECPFARSREELARLVEISCPGVGLDLNLHSAQGYDGRSNMSGECKGAAGLSY